jgi:nucleoside-diphosphate-sugar epimerase
VIAKVLLIGGTGAMGIYLRRELVSMGYDVYVTSRRERPAEYGVHYIVGNGKDIPFVRRVLSEVAPDVAIDFMIYDTSEFAERYNLFLDRLKQYMFLSSYRVFNEDVPLREESPRLLDSIADEAYLKTDEYALCKARCEDMLRKSGKKNWTILRPSITYSTMRFQFGCLEANVICYRALHGQTVIIPHDMLTKRTTMTWSGDVAKMIARLVLNRASFAEDFNVVTNENKTWGEIAEIYKSAIGMKVKEVSLSEYLGICGEYQVRYDRMFNRVMDNSKVLAATGLRQEYFKSLAEGLKGELLSNYGSLQTVSPNIPQNAKIDKICGIVKCPKGSVLGKLRYLQFRFPNVGIAPKTIAFLLRGVGVK